MQNDLSSAVTVEEPGVEESGLHWGSHQSLIVHVQRRQGHDAVRLPVPP